MRTPSRTKPARTQTPRRRRELPVGRRIPYFGRPRDRRPSGRMPARTPMTRFPPHRRRLLAHTAVAMALSAAPTLAQERDASEVSELIVTAQKREQAVIDVPMA